VIFEGAVSDLAVTMEKQGTGQLQVLGAEDCGLAGNGRVARPVNTSFSIRPDAECPEQLMPFDNPGEVLLKGRLWPFPQPSKRGASLAVGDLDQRVQLLPNGFRAMVR
jgi:hypothetical protein